MTSKRGDSEDVRKKLIQDLFTILNTKEITDRVKNNAINYAIYNWTEVNGKYEGNEFWSEKAYKLAYVKRKDRAYQLVHEHIVPRSVIREKIINLENKDILSLYLIFEKYVIAAVITKEEDNLFSKDYDGEKLRSKMPKEFYREEEERKEWLDNPWARYLCVNSYNEIENNINIYTITWKGKGKDEGNWYLGPEKDSKNIASYLLNESFLKIPQIEG